jgi:ribosomal protein L40E
MGLDDFQICSKVLTCIATKGLTQESAFQILAVKRKEVPTLNTVACSACGAVNPADAMTCKQCGINLHSALRHSTEVKGVQIEHRQGVAATEDNFDEKGKEAGERQRNYAIIAVVLGCLSITLGWCIALMGHGTAIPGLILAHKARKMKGSYNSLANIAYILCWIGWIIAIINSVLGIVINVSRF